MTGTPAHDSSGLERESLLICMERAVRSLPDIDDAGARALVYATVPVPGEFAKANDGEALRRARLYRDRIRQGVG